MHIKIKGLSECDGIECLLWLQLIHSTYDAGRNAIWYVSKGLKE